MSDLGELKKRRQDILDAIDGTLATGQSYQIGTRKKTNIELDKLRAYLSQIDSEIAAAEAEGHLLPGVRQAYFDGR